MLDLFSLKTHRFRKNEFPTSFRLEIVKLVVDIFREPCIEKGLSLKSVVEDSVPEWLIIDAQRYIEILMNLLQNALKFTYTGGIELAFAYN